MLSKQAVKEFAEIYYREFGIILSIDQATEHANRLMGLYKIILSGEVTPTKNISQQQMTKRKENHA